MLIYRLGTSRYRIWDGTGAAVRGGRWNLPGAAVIYAAAAQSLAMLERLVQGADLGGTLLVEAEVLDDLAYDELLRLPPPGWADVGSPAARAAGRDWLAAGRPALLRVPSVVVPREANWVVKPRPPRCRAHPGGRARVAGVGPAPVRHTGAAAVTLAG